MAIAFVHPREGLSPYPGGKLYFYDPGTTTARTVYQDADLTSAHAQPVIANAVGIFPTIYLPTGTFKARLETAMNVLVYEQDNVDPGVATGPGALPISSGGTGAANAIAALSNLGAAASSDLTAAQNAVAILQSQVSASLVGGNTRLGLMAGRDTVRAVDLDDTEYGQLVAQHFFTAIAGQQTTTSVIPADTSIPQIGEGAEIWSQSITPKFSNSRIVVRAHFTVIGANTVSTAFALFDGGTNAIAVTHNSTPSGATTGASFSAQINSWGTSDKTLSIRYGPNTGTATLNGTAYGGSMSSVEVLEIKGGPF